MGTEIKSNRSPALTRRHGRPPAVSGHEGMRALATAIEIVDMVE